MTSAPEPEPRDVSAGAPAPTYRIFDGRRWHGPFRREELLAQGLRPDSLVKAGAADPTRADLVPELQQLLLASSVPLAAPASGALLAYEALPPGATPRRANRAWAFASLTFAGAAWAAMLPLCEGAPPSLLRLRFSTGPTPLLVTTFCLGFAAVLCGTVGVYASTFRGTAALGRFAAWMTPVAWCAASWAFATWTETDTWFQRAAPSELVCSFCLLGPIALATDSVLDRLVVRLGSRFPRRRA